jgi:hypothetical protein
MRDRRWFALLAGICLSWLAPYVAAAEPDVKPADEAKEAKEAKDVYLRVLRDDKGEPLALQTSVVRYIPKGGDREGLVVELVGAVHVGDKTYYDELNKVFEGYDALLFELVAPEGTRIPKGGARGGGGSAIGGLQRGMQSMLELEFQLDCVDYTKKNFVHADMSPDEFAKSMKDRKESVLQMIFKAMGQGAAQQGKGNDTDLLFALFSRDRAFRLKRAMADQFENLEGQMAIFEGPDGSTIITERNKKALEVLKREIEGGKKKLGIFYGAGHLADMHKRLVTDFEMKKESERWINAWSLETPAKKPAPKAKQPEKLPKPAEELPEPAEAK